MSAALEQLVPQDAPEAVLRRVFGFSSFRGLQEQAIRHVVAGGDALVLMPTGGGKSLCYQIPAICRDGVGLVVSPLIALMDDQVAAMRQAGVRAAALHSEREPGEVAETRAALESGRLDLLYVSPERLLTSGTLAALSRRKLALIAIDEAHCVSAWGHEFRPEYRDLARLGESFPGVPRVALTATADPRTREDVLTALGMTGAARFVASFHRPNLHLTARGKNRPLSQLLAFLRDHEGQTGIVYCGTRSKTESTAASLQAEKLPAIAFHAGLWPDKKREALARFRSGEPLIVVATIAFGMGIDRPDVRFVAHLDMPDSPEAYYQQIGRAGRDGDPAHALLLYGGEDFARARYFLAQSQALDTQKAVMRDRLEAMIAFAESADCRTRALLAHFGEVLPEACGHCDSCAGGIRTEDGTEAARLLLSAVYRTGQMFGTRHLAHVLRGEANDVVTRNGHERLALFGRGRARSADYWRGVARQLVARGALRVRAGTHGSLELVPDVARPILKGETAVMLREEHVPTPLKKARADRPAETGPGSALFEALRAWRSAEAKRQGVPPYVIFHDTSLREIAAARPATLGALGAVKGVGATKLERYGEAVLQVLASA